MRLRPFWVMAGLLAASSLHAAPPLAKSFQAKPSAAATSAPPSAGLAQPLPSQGRAASSAAPQRTVVPDPVARPASAVTSSYRISAGDQLDIYVWGDERLQRTLSVLPDGTFAFPLAGTVSAAGRTPNELEAELSKLLADQYKGIPPQVTVSVRQPSGMQVSVIGRGAKGSTTIAPTRYITVLDALALTGGPSDFADINGIVVLRRVNGKMTVIKTHLGNALKGKPTADDLSDASNPVLMAGDTVVVP